MDRLLSTEAFVRVARTGSFTKAAEQLGVTRSVVTLRVQQLEKFINAPLFHRSTRQVRLSDVGELYYQECADVIASFHGLTEKMRYQRSNLTGQLRVQVLQGFAIGHLGALLAKFTKQYPDIDFDVVVNDRVIGPIEEGFDVAFQLFPATTERVVVRKLFTVHRLFCAAPEYLEQHCAPEHPLQLHDHRIALYGGYSSRNRWQFNQGRDSLDITLHAQMRSSSLHLIRDYARSGAGITCLPTLIVSDDVISGRLVPVLSQYRLPTLDFVAIYPQAQRQALKVGTLIDFLAEHIGPSPDWDQPLIERGLIG
ncbi:MULTISPECIES: LysR family transcriptional regulator [Pseudomonas]|uniref:LysR family transcriptional regulator n=1 Tax=Pseudomonas fluorescens TaxID=294 RepID=A0A159ZY24_PSEFL|nr:MULTISPECIES: LysR family transcriptional regulator [Pseudomonas]AMZ71202.1 LysR family transcriptional regulator [Pseudomonas fluorescens]SEI47594.1 DNA-binding transcriptional regulator, LysR family [Pseudomonas sp. NFACC07-1]